MVRQKRGQKSQNIYIIISGLGARSLSDLCIRPWYPITSTSAWWSSHYNSQLN